MRPALLNVSFSPRILFRDSVGEKYGYAFPLFRALTPEVTMAAPIAPEVLPYYIAGAMEVATQVTRLVWNLQDGSDPQSQKPYSFDGFNMPGPIVRLRFRFDRGTIIEVQLKFEESTWERQCEVVSVTARYYPLVTVRTPYGNILFVDSTRRKRWDTFTGKQLQEFASLWGGSLQVMAA